MFVRLLCLSIFKIKEIFIYLLFIIMQLQKIFRIENISFGMISNGASVDYIIISTGDPDLSLYVHY